MATFNKRKKFNGKWYTLKRTFGWKSDALNFQNRMKNTGYLTRLVKSNKKVAHNYALYIRKK